MNYRIIREIIVLVKRKLKCPGCGKSISNREISIENVQETGLLLKCDCKKCLGKTLVEIKLSNDKYNKQRRHKGLEFRTASLPKISHDDVLDIKNFLQNFKGDFKEIFKK